MRPALFALFVLTSAAPAWPALTWENRLVEMEASPVEDHAVAIFHFKNTGDTTVTITGTHASCGCTTPALDKKEYAPGESGELRAIYAYGEATGKQEKSVTVTTDEPGNGTYILTLRVTIPALFEVQPRFVMWKQNDAATTKSITIHALRPDLAKPMSVETRDPRFKVELLTSADDPSVYTIAITPQDTAATMFTSVTVQTSGIAEKKSHPISVFATVR